MKLLHVFYVKYNETYGAMKEKEDEGEKSINWHGRMQRHRKLVCCGVSNYVGTITNHTNAETIRPVYVVVENI